MEELKEHPVGIVEAKEILQDVPHEILDEFILEIIYGSAAPSKAWKRVVDEWYNNKLK
jgi:hypothetical protein